MRVGSVCAKLQSPISAPLIPGWVELLKRRLGSLVQLDGSPFAWLEDRGPRLTLLGAIDDATNTVLALHFRPAEERVLAYARGLAFWHARHRF